MEDKYKCPYCDGKGKVLVSGPEWNDYYENCSHCHGSGKKMIEVSLEDYENAHKDEKQKEKEQLYKKAIEKWGKELQITLAIEEMSELQKELCKYLRGDRNRSAILEEITDVEIMIEQIKIILNVDELNIKELKEYKINRLKKRIEGR